MSGATLTEEGLEALRTKPGASTDGSWPYLKKDLPLDPWGKAYAYRARVTMAPLILFPTVPMEQPAVKGITMILRAGSGNQGFSLLELMLVLLLLGVSSLIVLPDHRQWTARTASQAFRPGSRCSGAGATEPRHVRRDSATSGLERC